MSASSAIGGDTRAANVMTTMSTPWKPLTLVSDGDALTGCWFGETDELYERMGLDAAPRRVRDLGELSSALAAYFDGDVKAIDGLPVRQPGSEFRRRCWDAMRAVPAGETISYSELAARSGNPNAVRAAGSACARNLVAVVVPCHRIVTSGGKLGGYAYGLPTKQWLLAHETGEELLG